jgi:hypothetical protein
LYQFRWNSIKEAGMRRAVAFAALTAGFVLASCADNSVPTGPRSPEKPLLQSAAPVPGTCTTLAHLKDLTNALFGAGSPNANSVLGKLNNLQHQIDIGDFATARQRALDIVAFVEAKWKTGGLPGTLAQKNELVWGTMCYAGFAVGDFDPNGVVVFTASDTQQQEGYREDDQAGLVIPPGGFNAPPGTPVVVSITLAPGLLHTKLDQYPGRFSVSSSAPLNGTVVVGVCLSVYVDPSIRPGLRLGHSRSDGSFEITPQADPPPGLNCPTITGSSRLPSWLASLARRFLPEKAMAASFDLSGGIGGSASDFSDFGPVDTELRASGGVGGSAGDFIKFGNLRFGNFGQVEDCSATVGTQVSSTCRPEVTVTTALGTPLLDVPVDFTVEAGGGTVAAEGSGGSCGSFAAAITALTNGVAKARSCWTLGTVTGTNTVRGRPRAGGDAPAGTTFSPPSWVFNQHGNPGPAADIKTYMPPSSPVAAPSYDYGSGLTPYTAVNPAPQVRVTDQYGNAVSPGTSVSWTADASNGAALTVGSGATTGSDGIAQVGSWALGDGSNILSASIGAGFDPANFFASTPTGISIFACSAGTGNAKTDVAPMSIPAPNGTIKKVTFWMSVNGQASAFSDYDATLEARLNGISGTLLKSTTGKVQLPGDNGKARPVTFTFPTSIGKQTGNATIWFILTITTPANRKPQIWYLNSTFKNNDPCASSIIYNATGTSVSKKGLSINVTN